ncbi:MAG: glycosyltransferase family 4 protein [bacterium]
MRIAQCLQVPLFDHGGVEVLVREMIRRLHDVETETFLVSPTELSEEQRQALTGIKGTFVWNPSASSMDENARLSTWLREHHIDLAHFHLGGTYGWGSRSWNACPIPLVARSGIPCVSTNHGAFSIFDCVGKQRPLWFKILSLPPFWISKLRQLSHVQWEATVSQHDLHAVKRWFFPMRRKFLQLYHSRLCGDEFSSLTSISDLRTPNNPYILCLGTVGERKGQQYLVEAFLKIAETFPDWQLVIAGRQAHEPTMAKIKGLIGESPHAGRVHLLSDVPDDLAHDLMSHAEIFAIPSTAEGLGLSLQEAMFAGAACIGSCVGGIQDLIMDGKTGLLVRPADPGALATGLKQFMSDKRLRERMGSAGRASVTEREMTVNGMVRRYLNLYHETILGGSNHRS